MNTSKEPVSFSPLTEKTTPSALKTLVFILEVSLIIALLLIWFFFDEIQQSKNLWVLFFYCFPAEFLIAIVPHEPVILYFGKFYSPLTVALVTISGTLLTEVLNYSTFQYVTDTQLFKKISHKKMVSKVVGLFKKAPFAALCVAGFTPIPFYPFRFLVVMAHYPLFKYLLAVFLSRTPRFYILAFLGYIIKIPDSLLIILFVVLIVAMNIPLLQNLLKKRKHSS